MPTMKERFKALGQELLRGSAFSKLNGFFNAEQDQVSLTKAGDSLAAYLIEGLFSFIKIKPEDKKTPAARAFMAFKGVLAIFISPLVEIANLFRSLRAFFTNQPAAETPRHFSDLGEELRTLPEVKEEEENPTPVENPTNDLPPAPPPAGNGTPTPKSTRGDDVQKPVQQQPTAAATAGTVTPATQQHTGAAGSAPTLVQKPAVDHAPIPGSQPVAGTVTPATQQHTGAAGSAPTPVQKLTTDTRATSAGAAGAVSTAGANIPTATASRPQNLQKQKPAVVANPEPLPPAVPELIVPTPPGQQPAVKSPQATPGISQEEQRAAELKKQQDIEGKGFLQKITLLIIKKDKEKQSFLRRYELNFIKAAFGDDFPAVGTAEFKSLMLRVVDEMQKIGDATLNAEDKETIKKAWTSRLECYIQENAFSKEKRQALTNIMPIFYDKKSLSGEGLQVWDPAPYLVAMQAFSKEFDSEGFMDKQLSDIYQKCVPQDKIDFYKGLFARQSPGLDLETYTVKQFLDRKKPAQAVASTPAPVVAQTVVAQQHLVTQKPQPVAAPAENPETLTPQAQELKKIFDRGCSVVAELITKLGAGVHSQSEIDAVKETIEGHIKKLSAVKEQHKSSYPAACFEDLERVTAEFRGVLASQTAAFAPPIAPAHAASGNTANAANTDEVSATTSEATPQRPSSPPHS